MPFRAIAAVVLLALVSYGLLEAYPLFSGPHIALSSPAQHESIENGIVVVSGKATHTETLFLNDAPLLMDETGSFSRELLLPRGGAILSVTAYDRFGRSVETRRTVYIP